MADKMTRRQFVRDTAVAISGVTTALAPAHLVRAGNPGGLDTGAILNYNVQMEYRRCGKTGLMVSAVGLGGHWKRLNKLIPGLFRDNAWLTADINRPDFSKNRADVVSRCIDRGINYVDACTRKEVIAYARALKGRRNKMYFGYSWYEKEFQVRGWRSFAALKRSLDQGLKTAGLDYVDLWRITMRERSSRHTDRQIEELIKSLEWAKKTGRARFGGVASHDRPHLKKMIEKYHDQLDAVLTPYTAKTTVVKDPLGLYATITKHDIGWFGFKPFCGGTELRLPDGRGGQETFSFFRGDGTPGNAHQAKDDIEARNTIRRILCNPAITAPIPGLASVEQVDSAALAVLQRRELDTAEQAELRRTVDRAWANLPRDYRWLKDWQYV